MKGKFHEYEAQSEKYYSEMLSNFKKHAKEQMQKKQKNIETLTQQITDHQLKIRRITDRIHERKILGIISDESDDEEDNDPSNVGDRTVTLEELQFVKSKRRQIKLGIKKWVTDFQAKNERMPTERDTAIIAPEIMEFNFVNQQYLAFKLKLLKQHDLPFDPNEFYKPVQQMETKDKIRGR